MNGPLDNSWLERMRLVRYFREAEADMNLHKWYQSEKQGHDIGWQAAVVDWTLHIAGRYFQSHPAEDFVTESGV